MNAADARILIVDDEPANVRLLERLLLREGYAAVRGVTDPALVLPLLPEMQPDLILLDLHMPGLDGFTILELLQRHLPQQSYLPVLAITADATDDTRRRALSSGARDFLVKPFDAIEVMLRIRNLLETRRLYQRLEQQNALLEERVRERTRELEAARMEVVARLIQAAELRDDDTGRHIQRVAELCARIARALHLPEPEVELLRRAAPLHDAGKIAIPDTILLKAGRLTPAEFEIMKTHTTVGASILSGSGSELLLLAERIALSHHERWDGTGYPHGLRGEEIPLPARILAVADVCDALSSDRPYRRALPLPRVLEMIREGSGSHFDPRVVQAFLTLDLEAERADP